MTAKPMRVVMTYKVRDEADVLEANLRYHAARGVDFFIATDNGSTDGTRELLARYEAAGLARLIDEPVEEMSDHGHEWLTRMAQLAATEHEADWVLHNDADEFWWPLEGSLPDALGAIDPAYGAVYAPRVEFVGRPDAPGDFTQRLTVRETVGRLRPKVAHRAHPSATVLHRGGHDVVAAEGTVRDALRPPGRAVLRAAREERADQVEDTLVPAPVWPIRIFHFPLRSSAQYRHRVELGVRSFPDQKTWRRMREALEAGRLDDLYAELVHDEQDVAEGVAASLLTEDTRLRDYLPLCPDPLAEGPRVVSVPAQSAADLARERAEVARDAMLSLARNARLLEVRLGESRDRIGELNDELVAKGKQWRKQRRKARLRKERLEKLQRQLAAERARPWGRFRRLWRHRKRRSQA